MHFKRPLLLHLDFPPFGMETWASKQCRGNVMQMLRMVTPQPSREVLTREASVHQAFIGVSAFGPVLPASIFELTPGWNDPAKVDSETTQS
jgi:hypothetical protein